MGIKVLIIGGGGREHALAWKIAESPQVNKLFCAPGNAGIAQLAECVPIDQNNVNALRDFAVKNRIDLTVVGPEMPLTLGIVDVFEKESLRIFGPSKKASQLEASKIFAKQLMKEHGILTADFITSSDAAQSKEYVTKKNISIVVKADGLAAGKGVFPCFTASEAVEAIERILVRKEFGKSGEAIVIEEFLNGEEASFICFTDGTTVVPMPSSQDHKRVFDNDQGPNTGGMGAYSPTPVITPEIQQRVMQEIMYPVVKALSDRGITYKGAIYAGLMLDAGTPQVLEFNVRFGDPETQPLILRLKSDIIEIMNTVIDERLSEISVEWDQRPSVCVVMASQGYPGKYEKGHPIRGLEEAAQVKNTVIFHAGTSLKNNQVVTDGGRVLGVTALGDTISDAIQNAYRCAEKIYWNGVHFRKDIGKRALNR